MARAALEATELYFTHPGSARGEGRPALDGLSLAVEGGSFTGLLGPNGAGKTTFVNHVAGLFAQDSGTLRVFGEDARSRAARRDIGICPQELALYPTLSATENLALFARLAGVARRRIPVRIDACLELATLTRDAERPVAQFSGGMKRRLNLAVALVHEPRLLLLDEPTVGVDTPSRLAIFDALEEIAASGTTLVYTTHYMEEVERLCPRVIVIDHGRALFAGETRELVSLGARAQVFRLELRAGALEDVSAAARAAGLRAEAAGDGALDLSADDFASLATRVAELSKRDDVLSCETRRPTLEERFLELTGEGLRDA